MYFPYLRGKQFELNALLEVPRSVYSNTLPVVEPVNDAKRLRLYEKLANNGIPFIFITNPFHPHNNRLASKEVQGILGDQLKNHQSLILGFIIDQRFNIHDLNIFLTSKVSAEKAIIFRHNPLPAELAAIQSALTLHTVKYVIFDDRRTNNSTRSVFRAFPRKVLITDGFQRQDRNADYPAVSSFESNYQTWREDGWVGIGDYLSIGDFYQDGGGQVYVITLHVTVRKSSGLEMHHFSSTLHATTKGLPGPKFAQASTFLTSSPDVVPLSSKGLDLFRDWKARKHNPQLGAAKKASMMHHIELMSSLI